MKKSSQKEFDKIVNDIMLNNKFRELDNELHHGISRLGHSMRDAKTTYKVTKKLHLNYKSATRAALMHDFYLDNELNAKNCVAALFDHPAKACETASEFYNLSSLESNIIKSHMFPLGKTLPKYAESWVVTLADKTVALYEMYRFKLSLKLGIYLIFAFNMITVQR